MIVLKILFLGLFLSTINTGESRHQHQNEKPRRCKCQGIEPTATEETPSQTTEPKNTNTTDKPEAIATTTQITQVPDKISNINRSGKPLGLSLIPLYDIKKDAKLEKKESSKSRTPTPNILGRLDNHDIISPTDGAAVLQSWTLKHSDNKRKMSLQNEDKHLEFPSGSRLNKQLYAQVPSQEHYLSLPQYKVKDNNYDTDRLLSKSIKNPYHYVINTQESKIPHLSRVDEHSDTFIPLHQYGVSTELIPLEKNTLPRVDVIKNKIIPVYAQSVPLDFQSIHELMNGDMQNSHNIPISHISIKNSPLKRKNSLKHGKWVEGQIDKLKSGIKGTDNIETGQLGYALLQILSQNEMHITENGMLVDAQGTAFDVQTLNLTPILIGNTLSSRSLLQGKYGEALSNLYTPYLQAILVTSLNSSKMLGIMSLETMYLLHSIISNLAQTPHFSLKPEQFESDENVNQLTNDAIKTLIEKKKFDKMLVPRDDHFGLRRLGSLNLGHFYRPNNKDDLPQDLPISRTEVLHNENTLFDEDASHTGRILTPKFELRKQLAHFSRDAPESDTMIDPDTAYSRFEIPGLSQLFEFAMKSKSSPPKVKSSLEVNNEADAQRAATFSGIFRTFQNPSTDVLHDLKVTEDLPSVGGETVLPIHAVSVTHPPVYRKSFKIHTIPLSFSRISNLKTKHDSDLSVEELGVSRMGGETHLPEIPPENHNDNTVVSVVDVSENYDDDDDGDFRIIGGNAATGSGTPLNNKGRSGYVA